MKLIYDPGTEQYVRWAKERLKSLIGLRYDLKVPKLSKYFVPATGVLIHIVASEFGDMIRITGSAIAGRQYLSTLGASSNLRRWYRIKSSKLDGYSELTAGVNYTQPVVSLDGKATGGDYSAVTPNQLRTSWHEQAEITTSVPVFASGVELRIESNLSPLSNENLTPTPRIRVAENGRGWVELTEKGELAVAHLQEFSGTSAWPMIVRPETGDVVCNGIPQFVSDFYAGLSLPHNFNFVPAGNEFVIVWTDTSGLGTINMFVRDPLGSGNVINPSAAPFFDPWGNQIGCIAKMPYFSSGFVDPAVLPGPGSAHQVSAVVGWRVELRLLQAGQWVLVYSEDYPNCKLVSATFSYGSTSQFVIPAYTGDGSDFSRLPHANTGIPSIAKNNDPIIIFGTYDATDSNVTYRTSSGTTIGTVPTGSNFPNAWVPGSFVTGTKWLGSWGTATVSAKNTYSLEPNDGSMLLAYSGGASIELWKNGVLVQSWANFPPATADSTNYPTYKDVPASGFFGLFNDVNASGIYGWRFDKNKTFKTKVYTQMSFTPGSPPNSMLVYGGTVHIPGTGDFNALTGFGGGFNADGTVLYAPDGAGGFNTYTPGFFSPDTTFTLDGTSYTITSGSSTPDTYSWVTKTVDLTWDDTLGGLKVTKTYSDDTITVPSRGDLTETVSGVTTAPATEATLIQDYLVMRPSGDPRATTS